jgi:amino-acid N-acetyltransferase
MNQPAATNLSTAALPVGAERAAARPQGEKKGLSEQRLSGRWTIEPAQAQDMPAIAALLRAEDLPAEDIAPHADSFFVAREGTEIVGAIGAERHAPDALLRSLVVALRARGRGLGDELVRRLDEAGATWGVRRWWLLTTTAESFFTARGFARVERTAAPPAIQGTGQFCGGCCASAVCLTRPQGGAP